MVGKLLRAYSEAHVEFAEFSHSVDFLPYRGAYACYGGRAKRKRRANRGAAAGRLCVGERTERHPGAIEADGGEDAVRSSKDARREMGGRPCHPAPEAGDGGGPPTAVQSR